MSPAKRVLFLSNSLFASGAEKSLHEFIENESYGIKKFVVFPKGHSVKLGNTSMDTYCLPLKWFYKTLNPVKQIQFATNIIMCSLYLAKLTRQLKIGYVYANTTKALIYAIAVKILTGKKIIWHVRDNKHSSFQYKLFTKYSDTIITVSTYIANQIETTESKLHVVHGGVDPKKWSPINKPGNPIRDELKISEETILIAAIGQLSRWKNQTDFIKAADKILKDNQNVHFLIIGDDLSKREAKFKNELKTLVRQFEIDKQLSFLGHRNDIQEIMAQIDILVHTAINEPFGRVIIEAMAMEKPVVAYNSGGIPEIVLNNKTGFLVEPFHYTLLAKKTALLASNKNLREKLGHSGRKRIINQFNMEDHSRKIERILQC